MSDVFEVLRQSRQFTLVRAMVQLDPDVLGTVMDDIEAESPELYNFLTDNTEEFIALLNEPIYEQDLPEGYYIASESDSDDDDDDDDDDMDEDDDSEGPLDFLRHNPDFVAFKLMLQENPALMNDLLMRGIKKTNPKLHQLIQENPEEFVNLLNEEVDEDDIPEGFEYAPSSDEEDSSSSEESSSSDDDDDDLEWEYEEEEGPLSAFVYKQAVDGAWEEVDDINFLIQFNKLIATLNVDNFEKFPAFISGVTEHDTNSHRTIRQFCEELGSEMYSVSISSSLIVTEQLHDDFSRQVKLESGNDTAFVLFLYIGGVEIIEEPVRQRNSPGGSKKKKRKRRNY